MVFKFIKQLFSFIHSTEAVQWIHWSWWRCQQSHWASRHVGEAEQGAWSDKGQDDAAEPEDCWAGGKPVFVTKGAAQVTGERNQIPTRSQRGRLSILS